MADVNFEIKEESLAVVRNSVIEANFDEVKSALTEMVEPYRTMVVQENDIPNAKADRAKIRKVINAIESVRKTVKNTYQEPLKVFEAKCKELVAICDSGAENIDRQVKEYEAVIAAEKVARIREVYDSFADTEEYSFLPWDAVYTARWENKGYDEEQAKQEIRDAMQNVREDIATIRELDSQDVPYLLDYYKSTRLIREVLRKAGEIKARRDAEIQRLAAQEMARKEAEARRKAAEESAAAAAARMEQPQAEPTVEEDDDGEDYEPVTVEHPQDERLSIVFRAVGTREQFNQLKVFMQSLGMGLYRV